jgi:selT/selW/selH selenoprotein domain
MSRIYYRFLIAAFYLFLQSQSFSTIGVSLTGQKQRYGTAVFLALTNVKSKDNGATLQRDNANTKQTPNLSIEYCTGCRWLLRASWFMQECLTTFEKELGSVTLIPSKPPSPGGTFLLKLDNSILWDRTVEKSFPEAKVIKQLIRDQIAPTKDLGHSDDVKNIGSAVVAAGEKCVECEEVRGSSSMIMDDRVQSKQVEEENVLLENQSLPNVNIRYCNESKWMMRANWICQEILATFQEEVRSVTLTPVRSLTQEDGNRGIFVSTVHFCANNSLRTKEEGMDPLLTY